MLRIALMALLASPAAAHDYPVQIERWVDSDTMDGTMDMGLGIVLKARFRLMCINSPEQDTAAGQALTEAVKGLSGGTVEPLGRDSFGRVLSFYTPTGWDETLNAWLYRQGAPLYGRLSRADRVECLRRLSRP